MNHGIAILYMLILIMVLVATKKLSGKIILLNTLFTTTWCIGGLLNLLGYANMNSADNMIHGYIILTIIIFNSTYIKFSDVFNGRYHQTKCIDLSLSTRVVTMSNIIAFVYMIPFFFKAIRIIRVYSFSELRQFAFVASDEFTTLLESRIIIWIIAPIIFASMVIAVASSMSGKFHPLLIASVLLNVAMYTFILGGKMLIVITMLLFVFMFIINAIHKTQINHIKIKKRYILFLGIAIIYLIIATNQRALRGLNLIENFLVYNYGGISYFDAILTSKEFKVLNSVPLYGRGVFGFILTPLLYIFRHLFSSGIYDGEFLTKQITTYFLPISESYNFNSHPTALYIFWRDTNGLLGIVIGAIFISLLAILIEKYFYRKNNLRAICLLLFLYFSLFMTTQKYMLLEIQSIMNIVFILLFTSKMISPIEKSLKRIDVMLKNKLVR